eukprot:Clim_evm57s236 gene=Clim_evmTU57s236
MSKKQVSYLRKDDLPLLVPRGLEETWGERRADVMQAQVKEEGSVVMQVARAGVLMCKGLVILFVGCLRGIFNKELRGPLKDYFLENAQAVFKAYSMFIGAAIAAWPLTLGSLLISPASFVSTMLLVPSLSINWVGQSQPHLFSNVFNAQMLDLDEEVGKDMVERMKRNTEHKTNFAVKQWDKIRKYLHFYAQYTVIGIIGWLPFVGPFLVPALQAYVLARKMSWLLLKPYMKQYLMLTYKEQQTLMRYHWAVIFGFTYPLVLLAAIPFAGVFVMGLGQAAVATLVLQEIGEVRKTDQSRAPSEGERNLKQKVAYGVAAASSGVKQE